MSLYTGEYRLHGYLFAAWYNAKYAAFLPGTGKWHRLDGGTVGKDGLEK